MAIQITIVSLDLSALDAPITKVFNKKSISFGRDPDCDVVLDRPEVSAEHAILRLADEGDEEADFYIEDIGSSNGTLLENEALEAGVESKLQALQRIIIGTYLIKPQVVEGEYVEEDEDDEVEAEQRAYEKEDVGATVSIPVPEEIVEAASVQEEEEIIEDVPESEEAFEEEEADDEPEFGPTVVQIDGNDISGFDFVATELFAIKGVIATSKDFLEDVFVDGGELGTRNTDSEGCFVFEEIPEGTEYCIRISKEGYRFEPNQIEGLVDQGDAELDINGRQLFTISGVVEHQGQPLAGVRVDGGPLGVSTTDQEGVFSFTGVPDGEEYSIEISKTGYSFESVQA